MLSPTPHPDNPVVLFDGACNLCNGLVVFIIRNDPKAVFRFAALQTEASTSLLRAAGVTPESLPDSVALVESGRIHVRSSAVLRVAGRLRFPWPLMQVVRLVPRPLRDAAYDFIARRRYRWFGRRQVCMVPAPHLMGRFLK